MAFQAALDAVPATGAKIYLPSGTYVLSAQLTHSGKPLTLYGDGPNKTILSWTAAAATAGISVVINAKHQRLDIKDITLISLDAANPPTKTAITVDSSSYDPGAGEYSSLHSVSIHAVEVRGTGFYDGGWLHGIYFNQCRQISVEDYTFHGYLVLVGDEPAYIVSGTAIKILGGVLGVPVTSVCYLSRLDISWADIAVEVDGYFEGVFLRDFNFVAVRYGVHAVGSANPPGNFVVDGGHSNHYITGIHGVDYYGWFIKNTLFFSRGNSNERTTGVSLTRCLRSHVKNNTFTNFAGAGFELDGIVIGAGCDDTMVTENIFASGRRAVTLSGDNIASFNNHVSVAVTTALTNTGSQNITSQARGALGYAEVTADQGSITTEADLTSLTVTVYVHTGRRIKITCCAQMYSTVTNDDFVLRIKEGATELQGRLTGGLLANTGTFITAQVILTPSVGNHTYKATMARWSGTGTGTLNAAATQPTFFLVEDIGI